MADVAEDWNCVPGHVAEGPNYNDVVVCCECYEIVLSGRRLVAED